VPFSGLNFPTAGRHGAKCVIFLERGQRIVSESIQFIEIRYNSEEILVWEICTKTSRELSIFSELLGNNFVHYRRRTFRNAKL